MTIYTVIVDNNSSRLKNLNTFTSICRFKAVKFKKIRDILMRLLDNLCNLYRKLAENDNETRENSKLLLENCYAA